MDSVMDFINISFIYHAIKKITILLSNDYRFKKRKREGYEG